MANYTNLDDVKLRLAGKVRIDDNDADPNLMGATLANKLINEAEAQVEYDLSPRYAAPFVSKANGTFKGLPLRPTQLILKTLAELQSVMRILETDFGSGSAINADKYIASLQKRYDKIVNEDLLSKLKGQEDTRQWAKPPLPDLQLNYFNTEADDGYIGIVHVTSKGEGAYPSDQINDPSETFVNASFDNTSSGDPQDS